MFPQSNRDAFQLGGLQQSLQLPRWVPDEPREEVQSVVSLKRHEEKKIETEENIYIHTTRLLCNERVQAVWAAEQRFFGVALRGCGRRGSEGRVDGKEMGGGVSAPHFKYRMPSTRLYTDVYTDTNDTTHRYTHSIDTETHKRIQNYTRVYRRREIKVWKPIKKARELRGIQRMKRWKKIPWLRRQISPLSG